ncbi:hypothetical protein KY284_010310 [Solanum tuberosum]|nr:hypothetical protein KY284_010310 [Solanum tuberosum]
MDEKAASAIRLHLTDDVVNNIIDEESACDIWTKLENLYMSKTLTNELYLKKQLYALHMGEANLGVKIEEEDKFIVLLNSLPSSYDNLATTILHGNDSIELKDVTSTLLLNEKMRKSLKITDKLSSQKVETEVTKGVQATMVDSKLVESLRSDQNQRPEIATIVINQVNSKEIVRI